MDFSDRRDSAFPAGVVPGTATERAPRLRRPSQGLGIDNVSYVDLVIWLMPITNKYVWQLGTPVSPAPGARGRAYRLTVRVLHHRVSAFARGEQMFDQPHLARYWNRAALSVVELADGPVLAERGV